MAGLTHSRSAGHLAESTPGRDGDSVVMMAVLPMMWKGPIRENLGESWFPLRTCGSVRLGPCDHQEQSVPENGAHSWDEAVAWTEEDVLGAPEARAPGSSSAPMTEPSRSHQLRVALLSLMTQKILTHKCPEGQVYGGRCF